MRQIILIIAVIATLSSCKKCLTCSYTDETGTSQTTNETCGNKEDLDNFETGLNNTWGSFGTVTCSK